MLLQKVLCRRCRRLLGKANFSGYLETICPKCGCKQLIILKLNEIELKSEISLDREH